MSAVSEERSVRLRTLPQQARSQARIDATLEAAVRLLEREGVEAVTTTRVAVEATMAVGSVYRYFPDKAAILDALATRYLGEFEALMAQTVAQAGRETWDDPAGLLVDLYTDYFRSEPALRAIWFGTGLSEELLAADRQHMRTMAAGVHAVLLAQGVLPTPELATQCHAAVLTADAILLEAFRVDHRGDQALLEAAKTILRAFLASLER